MKKRLHYFQHILHETPGYILDWATNDDFSISSTKFFTDYTMPQINDFEYLVVMGGPMNIYEETKYSFLKKEKSLIEQAIKHNKKVIGICLGSQLLADVLGAKIKKNKHTEIGWFDVLLTDEGRKSNAFVDVPGKILPLHWHGDTFDIPKSAKKLGSSVACENQIFSYGDNVLGFQFHLEFKKENLIKLIELSHNDLIKNEKFIQTEENILKNNNINDAQKLIFKILDNFKKDII